MLEKKKAASQLKGQHSEASAPSSANEDKVRQTLAYVRAFLGRGVGYLISIILTLVQCLEPEKGHNNN